MMMSEVLSPAYVLHSRKYRDSSLIVELLTRDEGRISAVVRGARSKRGRKGGAWQPFAPLLVSFLGRGELRTVKHAEFLPTAFYLTGENLLLGLYVNELLVRVLGKFETVPAVFEEYQRLLAELNSSIGLTATVEPDTEPRKQAALRHFELRLLDELGYGISFTSEAGGGAEVVPGRWYQFVVNQGFYVMGAGDIEPDVGYLGEHLLAIAARQFDAGPVELAAKKITRLVFAGLLGGKPLKARELFKPVAFNVDLSLVKAQA